MDMNALTGKTTIPTQNVIEPFFLRTPSAPGRKGYAIFFSLSNRVGSLKKTDLTFPTGLEA
jgi:hypothetical protein